MFNSLCIAYFLVGYSFLIIESYAGPVNKFFINKNVGTIIVAACSENYLQKMHLRDRDRIDGGRILMFGQANINTFYPTFNSQHYPTGVYFNFSCESSKKIFTKMSNHLLLNMSYAILIASENYDSTIQFLEDSTISFDSDITLVVGYYLYGLYRIDVTQPLTSTVIGEHDNSSIINKNKIKRKNLNGILINTGLVWTGVDGIPYNGTTQSLKQMLDPTYKPELEFLTRFGYAIHKILEDAYNFRMNISVYNDWGYFNYQLNTWGNGMFRAIFDKEIELGITASRIFGKRMDITIFFPPFLKFRTCFIFKHPSMLAEQNALIKPLSINSWFCTLICVVLSALVVWYIRSFDLPDIGASKSEIMESITLAIGILCQQGLSNESLRMSMRIVYTFLLITNSLIYMFYGAAVVRFLLLPSPRKINTVEKLIESPITSYAENVAYHKTHFQGNFSEKATKAYEAIKDKTTNQERWINLATGIKKVRAGKVALYAQDTNLYTGIKKSYSTSDICALTEIEIVSIWVSTVIRKKSPFKELLFQGMMLTHENGLLHRTTKKWKAQRPACFAKEESPTVSLEATVIAHIIYTTGFVLSFVILVLEVLLNKLNKMTLKKYYQLGKHKRKSIVPSQF